MISSQVVRSTHPPAWPRATIRAAVAVLAVLALAVVVRGAHVLGTTFPLGDGGLFLTMSEQLKAAGYALPTHVDYNGTAIPFAYPPLGFFITAAISDVTGISLYEAMRLLPFIWSTLAVFAFWLLARTALSNMLSANGATFAFGVLPLAFLYFLMGAGIARGLGLVLAIMTIWLAYVTCSSRSPILAICAGLAAGLCILSHPNAAWFAAYSSALVFAFHCRDRRTLGLGMAALLAAGATSAPWIVGTIQRHGIGVFVSAAQSSNPGPAALELFLQLRLTQEPIAPLFGVLAVVGLVICGRGRSWWLPVWFFAACILDTRYMGTFSMVPLAMLAGIAISGLSRVLEKDWSGPLSPDRLMSVAVAAWLTVLAVAGALVANPALRSVPGSVQVAMRWVAKETPPDSRFAVIAPTGSSAGSESEWFPVLAERSSAGTYQGLEWLPRPADGVSAWERYDLLQSCGDKGVDCLMAWTQSASRSITHVFLREAGTGVLRAQLTGSTDFVLVYHHGEVSIFEHRPS